MTRAATSEGCPICGKVPHPSERRVLVTGRTRFHYCSQSCLRVGVRMAQIAQRKARRRAYAIALVMALALAGTGYLRHLLLRARPRRSAPIASAPVAAPPPSEPAPFGPSWPPTDEEWQAEFARAAWVDPLPGPTRRRPMATAELVRVDPKADARCRTPGRCAVELGGELWGEHVYAAHDGVVDRVRRSDEGPGGTWVRIAHWGGAVFTYYLDLAAVPTRLAPGMRVAAGEVIGLVGDTGGGEARARLRFALSVRPSSALPEIYWDPAPLMASWPLETPARGSVAGLVAADAPPEHVAGTPSVYRRPLPRPPAPRHAAAVSE